MRRASELLLLALAGCGDPRLDVSFEIPEPYRSALAQVVVQVFEPPVAAPFDCEALAYQRVPASVVALGRVSELETDTLSTPLGDLDRAAPKVLWVDGMDESRRRLVTGCAEIGEVVEDTELTVLAEVVPTVRAPAAVSLSATLGTTVGRTVSISVEDALARAVAGVPARFAVVGAAGSGSNGQAETDANGQLNISPGLPTRPGPFLLDVRVRWAGTPPVVLSGIIVPEPERFDLPGIALSYGAGAIGAQRQGGVVALTSDGLISTRAALLLPSAAGPLEVRSSDRLNGDPVLSVLSFEGRERDRVLAVSADEWAEVGPDGAVQRRSYTRPVGAATPVSLFAGGPCGEPPRVMVEFAEDPIATYAADGGAPLGPAFSLNDPGDVDRATLAGVGCVSDQTGLQHRALFAGFGNSIGLVAAISRAGGELVADFWFALPGALGFVPARLGAPRQVFATQLSVNDIVVSRATLVTGPELGSVAVHIDGTDVVPNVPISTGAGDLDGDGLVDVVALFTRPGQQTQLAAWMALGREHEGRRIVGEVDLPQAGFRRPVLLLVDLDGDKLDDVVIGDRPAVALSSKVEVLRMGAR